jgi:hypothetical protein
MPKMTALFPNLRYERKFLCGRLSLAQVLVLVHRHPALFREVFPPRAVNNIYLDSPGLRDYFAHVNGVANRAKTRIRWYGPLDGHIEKPTLERKVKRGLVSGKLTHPLPPLAFHRGLPVSQIAPALDRETVGEPLRAALRQLCPSLVNRYQRRYFLSADGRFRLTVDWDLQFWPARFVPGGTTAIRPREPGVIIELKFGPDHAEQAAPVTNALSLRMARCSKYVLGINLATGR